MAITGTRSSIGDNGSDVSRDTAAPLRIRASGVEIEAVITDERTPALRIKVKAVAVKAKAVKTKRASSQSSPIFTRH